MLSNHEVLTWVNRSIEQRGVFVVVLSIDLSNVFYLNTEIRLNPRCIYADEVSFRSFFRKWVKNMIIFIFGGE